MNNNMRKKQYVTPLIDVIHNESEDMMVQVSRWCPTGDKPGFGVIEEDPNNPLPGGDDSWGAKENGFFDNGDDFFRD